MKNLKEFMGSEDWRNINKQLFEYDGYGNQTRTEFYIWDEYNNKWTGNFKSERSFDENGNFLTSVSYGWDWWQGKWNPEYKEENTFAADSIQASNASYYWDLNVNKWIGNYKNETVFNDALEAIKRIDYEWDINAGAWKIANFYWVEHYKDQYDSEGKLQAYVYETWSETFNKWVPIEKYYYFWSLHSITTEIHEVLSQTRLMEVYPNPTTDYICVKTAPGIKNGTINIYNSSGHKIKTCTTVGDVTNINVNDLPAGNFILQFATEKNVFVKKIIIR